MLPLLNATERNVLAILWRAGEASRAEIAIKNGLTKPAITQVVTRLQKIGLVKEGPPIRGLRGQPARPLSLVQDAYFAVGVNYSHSYMDVGVVDLKGKILAGQRTSVQNLTTQQLAQTSCTVAEALLGSLEISDHSVLGLGFTAPGDFEQNGCLIAHSYFPGLNGLKLADELSRKCPLEVFVENDGKACAIGENAIGVGQNARSFLLVHIGHGIGGGIIIDNQLIRGAFGNAGPLGSFYPTNLPRPSGQDLLEFLSQRGSSSGDFDALEPIEIDQNPALREWLERASAQLETVVPQVSALLDIEFVVLGGRLPPHLLEYMVARIDVFSGAATNYPIPRPKVIASTMGPWAGVIGAAFLPIQAKLLPLK